MRPILLGLVLPLAALATACSISTEPGKISFESQTRFTRDGAIAKTSAGPWAGRRLEVTNAAPSIQASSAAGVTVQAEAGRTNVEVRADLVAYANGDDEASARAAIDEIVAGFTFTESADGIVVKCGGPATKHGSVGAAGCEHLRVLVPAGDEQTPHDLRVGLGNGTLTVTGVYGGLVGDSNGAGDVEVSMTPGKGSTVQLTSEAAITLTVPATFAADAVAIEVNEDDSAAASQRIDTTAFPEFENGKGIGTAGTGAKLVSLKSKGLLSSHTVTLAKR